MGQVSPDNVATLCRNQKGLGSGHEKGDGTPGAVPSFQTPWQPRLFGRFGRRTRAAGALLGRVLTNFAVIVSPRDRGRQDSHVQANRRFGSGHIDLARTTPARLGRIFHLRRGCLLDGRGLYDRRCHRGRRGLFDLRLRFGEDRAVATRTVATGTAILARFVLTAILVARRKVTLRTITLIARGAVIVAGRTIKVARGAIILTRGPVVILTRRTFRLLARGTVRLFAGGAIIGGRIGAEFVDAVSDAFEIIAILVEILVRAAVTLRLVGLLLFLPGAVIGQHAEIMVRKLQIIFRIHPVACHLGIARHILVFLKKLGRIATGAVVDAVAIIAPAPIATIIGTSVVVIVPAAIAATGLPVVDQDMILAFAVIILAENSVPSPSPSTACT
jgi:hypothetical protein